jgi:SET domain-containing protein
VSYKPLPDSLTIKESEIDGLGLFASQDISEGTCLGITHIYHEGEWLRTPLGGFINHSDDPNCICSGTDVKYLNTVKTICKGTELTLDYTLYGINNFCKND